MTRICKFRKIRRIFLLSTILSRLTHGGQDSERKRRDISFDRYDREDPCLGMKQIITGFSKWSTRYISSCSGQKNHSHQVKRKKKWADILNKGKGLNMTNLKSDEIQFSSPFSGLWVSYERFNQN